MTLTANERDRVCEHFHCSFKQLGDKQGVSKKRLKNDIGIKLSVRYVIAQMNPSNCILHCFDHSMTGLPAASFPLTLLQKDFKDDDDRSLLDLDAPLLDQRDFDWASRLSNGSPCRSESGGSGRFGGLRRPPILVTQKAGSVAAASSTIPAGHFVPGYFFCCDFAD